MDYTYGSASYCNGVRESYFPQTAYIAIGVLAAFVVMINSLAMVSVLKNYRRLRQRIYVFVISLAAVEILSGVVFLSDVLNRFFNEDSAAAPKGDDVLYAAVTADEGEKIIRLQSDNSHSISRELLEGLKASVVLLSVLNTALVIFALYKRTTSMGRHHEDFKHVSAGLASDSHSFLPAFDTMLRVLSVGGAAYTYGVHGNGGGRSGRGSTSSRNGDWSPKRRHSSSGSKKSDSPHRSEIDQSVFFSTEAGTDVLENGRDGGMRKNPPIVRMPVDRSGKPSGPGKVEMSKRNSGMTRLMSTGRRVSQAIRSRSTSGSQSYVGRHSYSVMSKPATACSLVFIWLLFGVTVLVPIVMRRSSFSSLVCPEECFSVKLSEVKRIDEGQLKGVEKDPLMGFPASSTAFARATEEISTAAEYGGVTQEETQAMPEPIINVMTTAALNKDAKERGEISGMGTYDGKPVEQNVSGPVTLEMKRAILDSKVAHKSPDEPINGDRNNQTSDNLKVESNRIYPSIENFASGDCVPAGYRYYGTYGAREETAGDRTTQDLDNGENVAACSACSVAFFPLSKSHALFTAIVVILTLIWLLLSASRLYYLRKHSTNVFVRCSALWRFMFMTALFYFFTLVPYVVWTFLDFSMPSPVAPSPLWGAPAFAGIRASESGGITNRARDATTAPSRGFENLQFHSADLDSAYTTYGIIATCSLLLNFAIAPTLYLVRLLGLRRIISAL